MRKSDKDIIKFLTLIMFWPFWAMVWLVENLAKMLFGGFRSKKFFPTGKGLMRKRDQRLIKFMVFWVIFLPFWVVIRIFKNLKNSIRQCDLINSEISHINTMSGVDFEEFLAVLFRKKGFKVQTTKTTGDFGADLILEGDGHKTAVQAKRYTELVGLDAIQEVLGARDYYKADKLMVITNNFFTNAAKMQAQSSNVILWDRGNLIQEISSDPNRATPVSEYLGHFFKRSLTDYKLIIGVMLVIFLYAPALKLVVNGSYSWPSQNLYDSTNQSYGNQNQGYESNLKASNPVEGKTGGFSNSQKRTGYFRYSNKRYGFSIELPNEFTPESQFENNSGYKFSSSNGDSKIVVYGINNPGYTISDLFNKSLNEMTGTLGFNVLKETWFVATWEDNDILTYRKSFLGKGSENTFIFTFPKQKKDYFSEALENIEDSFMHGNNNLTF